MKVHHIINSCDLADGGAQRIVRQLHDGLQVLGMESCILALLKPKNLSDTPNMVQDLQLSSPYSWRAFWGIRKYISKNIQKEDVIHAHLFPTNLYLSVLKVLGAVPCKLICSEHSTSNKRRGTFLGKFIDFFTYLSFDKIVAVSEDTKAQLIEWNPKLAPKIQVVNNGALLRFGQRIDRKPKKTLTILSVGTLREPKNYPNALRAIALLKHLDFEYYIAGDSILGGKISKQDLIDLSHQLGIQNRVHLLGQVDDITPILRKADIFLMPSLWEGFGLAAVEAMNASLPLVVSDVEGLRVVVQSKPPCALLADPRSPESIATQIEKLLLSRERRLQMGTLAFQKATAFDVDNMIAAYHKIYQQL